MGGYAYLIWGQLDEATVFSPRAASSLPGEGSGRQLAEPGTAIASRLREHLLSDFLRFIGATVGSPWPSTAHILQDYLQEGPVEYMVHRKARNGEQQLQWCLQITFSDCSGLAEVSSRLATHWTEIWYRDNHDRIDVDLLRPVGFFPSEIEDPEAMAFIPIGEGGYAEFVAEGTEVLDDGEQVCFALDTALYDGFDAEVLIRQLTDRFASLMSDGGCRCQLCAPSFDPSSVPRLRGVT